MSGKGKGFKLTSKLGKVASSEEKKALGVELGKVDAQLNIEPSAVTTAGRAAVVAASAAISAAGKAPPSVAVPRGMFGAPPVKVKAAAAAAPAVSPGEKPKAVAVSPGEKKPTAPVVQAKKPAAAARAVVIPEEKMEILDGYDDPALKALGEGFLHDEVHNPYTEKPDSYVPDNRRGFSGFIKVSYDAFKLKPLGKEDPVAPGDNYPYQKFIRDYMRNDSPYRGVLVYHGLGSGKTCTAIAASEALFSTSRKKIIVMTPASLRKNFLKEVSFCGFRHFRLKNFWHSLEKTNPTHRLFAMQILGLTENYLRTAKKIWVPDFRQGGDLEGIAYERLSAEDQTEIRKQILSQVIYNKDTNPSGRIHFINYNGVTTDDLKDFGCVNSAVFDNAVVVVDEIHNLVRLMHGKLRKHILRAEKEADQEKQIYEPIEIGKWKPTLCNSGNNYMRGYMLYRLFLGMQRTKIIGLSGTPLINFPEEIGILANILHGYIPSITFTFEQSDAASKKKIEEVCKNNLYVDYYTVTLNLSKSGSGNVALVTLLPLGVRKISEGSVNAVERIPLGEPIPTYEECAQLLKNEFMGVGLKIRGDATMKAYCLLPETEDEFREKFLKNEGTELDNTLVLGKRLTGLVSYYKGSRQDLMPKVIKDVIVYVPFSDYSRIEYTKVRKSEITKEKKAKKQDVGIGNIWDDAQSGNTVSSETYKMGSRQGCNFSFPQGVNRPKPATRKEEKEEVGKVDLVSEMAPEAVAEEKVFLFPEVEGEEEEAVVEEEEEEQAGGGDSDNEADAQAADAPVAQAEEAPIVVQEEAAPEPVKKVKKTKTLKELMEEKKKRNAEAAAAKARGPSDCTTSRLKDETYEQAIVRANECLRTLPGNSLILTDAEESLKKYSTKYAAMLENINEAPGSSLVYSQFLGMEGIGIFRIVMEKNGYAPIEILNGTTFTKATLDSLNLGPAGQKRFMTFSGKETPEIRRMYLDIFNGNFNELPPVLKKVFIDNKYTNNHKGEIARVFCITSAGAEGLSLKNVRAVHIMEPYWNDVRLRQVKGRAIRIGSHLELPLAERNVSIYTYMSTFGTESQVARAGIKNIDQGIRESDKMPIADYKEFIELMIREKKLDEGTAIPPVASYIFTSDERLFFISEKKKKIITELETLMKKHAIDCELNQAENKEVGCVTYDLKGKVGDFLYHPDYLIDITETSSRYAMPAVAAAAAAAPVKVATPAAAAPVAKLPTPALPAAAPVAKLPTPALPAAPALVQAQEEAAPDLLSEEAPV